MKNNVLVAGVVGVAAGAIDGALIQILGEEQSMIILLWLAGIPFGILTGIYFALVSSVSYKFLRWLAWAAISGVAYYLAVQTALPIILEAESASMLGYGLAGLIGSAILTLSFHALFQKLSLKQHLLVVVTGVAAAVVVMPSADPSFSVLYMVWQGAVAMMLAQGIPTTDMNTTQVAPVVAAPAAAANPSL